MELTVFHYHLIPGGVTTVIAQGIKALAENPAGIDSIRVVTGDSENGESFLSSLGPDLAVSQVSLEVVPGLGYNSSPDPADLDALKSSLLSKYGGSLWWVHNYHLGKNPLFTRAVVEIARENPEQRILLQIHDFPESARWQNLELLHQYCGSDLYPETPNVRYITINERDYRYLAKAGLDYNQIFLLSNPYTPPALSDKEVSRDYFNTVLNRNYPNLSGDALALYPVRAIRRKNILEAALICEVAEPKANLLVTLPGISETEKGYSALVEAVFASGMAPGALGAGILLQREGISYPDLLSKADLIVSSSLEEGFGYLFLESYCFGKALNYRDIDTLAGLKDLWQDAPRNEYNALLVPLSDQMRQELKARYINRVEGISHHLTPLQRERLFNQVEEILSSLCLDFSLLSLKDQWSVIRNLKDPGYREELRSTNSRLFSGFFENLCRSFNPDLSRVEETFGTEKYSKEVKNILSSFTLSTPPGKLSTGYERVHKNILEFFIDLKNLRLLSEPFLPSDVPSVVSEN